MNKIQIKKIVTMLLLFILTISLSGCKNDRIKESGDFKYFLLDDLAYVYELTEQGKEKEIIILPSKIDNYKTALGYRQGMLRSTEFIIESEKLNAIYFNSDIMSKTYHDNAIYAVLPSNENMIVFLPYSFRYLEGVESSSSIFNVYYSNDYSQYENNHIEIYNGKIANVSYQYNYEKDGFKTYFIDDVDGETLKNVPTSPLREGYIFDGWYKEAECINKWDFENDIIPAKEYDESGNYLYIETILYAKWK